VCDHGALLDTFRSILKVNRTAGNRRRGLTLPVPTRWYSVFNCLENVFNNRDVFEEIFTGPHHAKLLNRYKLRKNSREKLAYMTALVEDSGFWENLRVVVRLTRPIRNALGALESDTEHASSVYKWLQSLLNHEYYQSKDTSHSPTHTAPPVSPSSDIGTTSEAADATAEEKNDDEPPDVTASYGHQ
jgi:hypothetical protein